MRIGAGIGVGGGWTADCRGISGDAGRSPPCPRTARGANCAGGRGGAATNGGCPLRTAWRASGIGPPGGKDCAKGDGNEIGVPPIGIGHPAGPQFALPRMGKPSNPKSVPKEARAQSASLRMIGSPYRSGGQFQSGRNHNRGLSEKKWQSSWSGRAAQFTSTPATITTSQTAGAPSTCAGTPKHLNLQYHFPALPCFRLHQYHYPRTGEELRVQPVLERQLV